MNKRDIRGKIIELIKSYGVNEGTAMAILDGLVKEGFLWHD